MAFDWNTTTCCGYLAAAVACLAFGSFAVPIKTAASYYCPSVVVVDPLVLQTYKIGMNFVTSMLLFYLFVLNTTTFTTTREEDKPMFHISPWGLVSGLFMVPGGTAGYYAVQMSGLAISQGIWSCLKVLVAFAWGILVFGEPVRSMMGTTVAIVLLLVGLAGMSWYATAGPTLSCTTLLWTEEHHDNDDDVNEVNNEPLLSLEDLEENTETVSVLEEVQVDQSMMMMKQHRYWGLLGAVIDGAYGGSVLVPMHFAGHDAKGLAFLPSFATGCLVVVMGVWMGRFVICCKRQGSFRKGWQTLPSFHLSTIGPFATLAGLIWSVGNISSVVSVAMLGEGVGYSIVQSQLLIAGLWGALWFQEIRHIGKWFLFACVTIAGIVLLSNQHLVESHDMLL